MRALRCPGVHHPKGTAELQRFSAIMFSTFAREDRLWKPGNYDEMWQEVWRAKVEWREERASAAHQVASLRLRLAELKESCQVGSERRVTPHAP